MKKKEGILSQIEGYFMGYERVEKKGRKYFRKGIDGGRGFE
jgi:hypothetical protein